MESTTAQRPRSGRLQGLSRPPSARADRGLAHVQPGAPLPL